MYRNSFSVDECDSCISHGSRRQTVPSEVRFGQHSLGVPAGKDEKKMSA